MCYRLTNAAIFYLLSIEHFFIKGNPNPFFIVLKYASMKLTITMLVC